MFDRQISNISVNGSHDASLGEREREGERVGDRQTYRYIERQRMKEGECVRGERSICLRTFN